jgi:hypothetical protein
VLGVGRKKIILLVVPPQTDPDVAHEATMTAAAPSNDSTVGDLLAIGAHDAEAPTYHRPTFRRRIRRFRP